MSLEERYERLISGTFSDEELSSYVGIHPRSLRDLAKWGALDRAINQGGAGKKRLWSGLAIRRSASIAALNQAGISLPLAARINFYFWMDLRIANNLREMPNWEWLQTPGAKTHTMRHLIDLRDRHVKTHPDDVIVRIIDSELVFLEGRPKIARRDRNRINVCVGRLAKHDQQLLVWDILPRRMRIADFRPANPTYSVEESHRAFERAWNTWKRDIESEFGHEINPQFLAFREDPKINKAYAKRLLENHQSELNVNLTVAMKIALRKALGLPVTYP